MCKSHRVGPGLQACLISTFLMALACPGALARELSITPATMARIGTVDERFQSYNVEMVEVTGGRFWKPYGSNTSDVYSDLYAHRATIDLTNVRLRRLAAPLAPAYVRVSPWFQCDSESPAMARRGQFLASSWGADCDFIRHKPRHPRCDRRLDTGPGASLSRLYPLGRGHYRSRGVHERTQPCRDGRRADRLRRERIWTGLQDISLVYEADDT